MPSATITYYKNIFPHNLRVLVVFGLVSGKFLVGFVVVVFQDIRDDMTNFNTVMPPTVTLYLPVITKLK